MALLFGVVAVAAFIGGEYFLAAMGFVGCMMTLVVGGTTLAPRLTGGGAPRTSSARRRARRDRPRHAVTPRTSFDVSGVLSSDTPMRAPPSIAIPRGA